jgi:hypothetical protein
MCSHLKREYENSEYSSTVYFSYFGLTNGCHLVQSLGSVYITLQSTFNSDNQKVAQLNVFKYCTNQMHCLTFRHRASYI